jgi:hypothetical protein
LILILVMIVSQKSRAPLKTGSLHRFLPMTELNSMAVAETTVTSRRYHEIKAMHLRAIGDALQGRQIDAIELTLQEGNLYIRMLS